MRGNEVNHKKRFFSLAMQAELPIMWRLILTRNERI
jgi:hypothetical protein